MATDEVLYLEVDEDISTAIDRLKKAKAAKVSVVVPKRSTVLQSLINQKLLKKAAKDSGKQLVLVTGDRTATHLAGRVGIAVAANLKADAQVPQLDQAPPEDQDTVIEGQSAQPAKAAVNPLASRPVADEPAAEAGNDQAAEPAPAKTKGPKVPDFSRLQKRLIWAGLAVVLFIAWTAGNYLAASAKVTLYARGTKIPANLDFTVDPNSTQSDWDKQVLAGQTVTQSKDLTTSFTATGKKDAGTKAHGTVTIKNCDNTFTKNFPAGSVVSSQGKNFVTDDTVTIPAGTFGSGLVCTSPTVSVAVTASQNGDTYNLAPANYTSPSLNGDYRITGNQMTGGTTKLVTVVSQADINKAKQDLLDRDKDQAKKDLETQAGKSVKLIDASFAAAAADIKTTPALDQEATQATLNLKATYSLVGVKKDEFEKFIRSAESEAIGKDNQVYDTGIEGAKITAGDKDPSGKQIFHFSADAFGGPKLDNEEIARLIKGQRYGDAVEALNKQPGVERAELSLSPAWHTNVTGNVKKIKIEIKVSSVK